MKREILIFLISELKKVLFFNVLMFSEVMRNICFCFTLLLFLFALCLISNLSLKLQLVSVKFFCRLWKFMP
ncbi:hypothetical protein CW304_02885 [Bacillus sp. UFRGS-B20]|nr:hypothetical protein CW304_02885 [Bacillus sp. UFRGS-B20]